MSGQSKQWWRPGFRWPVEKAAPATSGSGLPADDPRRWARFPLRFSYELADGFYRHAGDPFILWHLLREAGRFRERAELDAVDWKRRHGDQVVLLVRDLADIPRRHRNIRRAIYARRLGMADTIEEIVDSVRTHGDRVRRELCDQFGCSEAELLELPGKRPGRAGHGPLAHAAHDWIFVTVTRGEPTLDHALALARDVFDPHELHTSWFKSQTKDAIACHKRSLDRITLRPRPAWKIKPARWEHEQRDRRSQE